MFLVWINSFIVSRSSIFLVNLMNTESAGDIDLFYDSSNSIHKTKDSAVPPTESKVDLTELYPPCNWRQSSKYQLQLHIYQSEMLQEDSGDEKEKMMKQRQHKRQTSNFGMKHRSSQNISP